VGARRDRSGQRSLVIISHDKFSSDLDGVAGQKLANTVAPPCRLTLSPLPPERAILCYDAALPVPPARAPRQEKKSSGTCESQAYATEYQGLEQQRSNAIGQPATQAVHHGASSLSDFPPAVARI